MRILFVAMSHSVHSARWISQVVDQGWDIHLFPEDDTTVHPDFRDLTVHGFLWDRPSKASSTVRFATPRWPLRRGVRPCKRILERRIPSLRDRAWWLARTIARLRPDIVHSLEMQHAGYLTLAAREHIGAAFPTWIVTDWGNDIYLFGRLSEHADRIRAVLSACDYYDCECQRDIALARAFGFKGAVLPVSPNTGGFDLDRVRQLRQAGRTSDRRVIALKGYQGWAGRALVALRAVALCAPWLDGYRLAIYSANSDVKIAAELLAKSAGVAVDIVPSCSHDDMLRLHGRSRVSIGLNISDGASTSLLEAMVMGSFPIQSCTACASEWVTHGESGMIVPPEDPEPVAAALRSAVTDDALVNRAADINARVAAERLDRKLLQPQAIEMYRSIVSQKRRAGELAGNGRLP